MRIFLFLIPFCFCCRLSIPCIHLYIDLNIYIYVYMKMQHWWQPCWHSKVKCPMKTFPFSNSNSSSPFPGFPGSCNGVAPCPCHLSFCHIRFLNLKSNHGYCPSTHVVATCPKQPMSVPPFRKLLVLWFGTDDTWISQILDASIWVFAEMDLIKGMQ